MNTTQTIEAKRPAIHQTGGGRFWSWDQNDSHPTIFKVTVYPGSNCESELTVKIYQSIGEIDEHGNSLGNPCFSFKITSDNPRAISFMHQNIETRHKATALAFSRAAMYGNGGFNHDFLIK